MKIWFKVARSCVRAFRSCRIHGHQRGHVPVVLSIPLQASQEFTPLDHAHARNLPFQGSSGFPEPQQTQKSSDGFLPRQG